MRLYAEATGTKLEVTKKSRGRSGKQGKQGKKGWVCTLKLGEANGTGESKGWEQAKQM